MRSCDTIPAFLAELIESSAAWRSVNSAAHHPASAIPETTIQEAETVA